MPGRPTTQEEDESNATVWLTQTDEELAQRGMSRELADEFARRTAGADFVRAWIKENRS